MRTNVIACDGKHSFELQDLKQLTAVLAIRFLELIYGTLQYSSSIDMQELGCLHIEGMQFFISVGAGAASAHLSATSHLFANY